MALPAISCSMSITSFSTRVPDPPACCSLLVLVSTLSLPPPPPPPVALLPCTLLCHPSSPSSLRANTWEAAWTPGDWDKDYAFSIEDPFDRNDNPARAVRLADNRWGWRAGVGGWVMARVASDFVSVDVAVLCCAVAGSMVLKHMPCTCGWHLQHDALLSNYS
jgi:hypothetical protein